MNTQEEIFGPQTRLVDDRKSRLYAREVVGNIKFNMGFRMPSPLQGDSPFKAAQAYLDSKIGSGVMTIELGSTWDTWLVYFTVRYSADKPSNVISAEKALDAFKLENYLELARGAVWAGLQSLAIQEERARIRRNAAHLLAVYRGQAEETAKATCRYNQRLAGLQAEVQAEFDAQADRLIEQVVAAAKAEPSIGPEAVRLFVQQVRPWHAEKKESLFHFNMFGGLSGEDRAETFLDKALKDTQD